MLVMQQALAVKPVIFNHTNTQSMEKWVTKTFNNMSPDERIAQIIIMPINPKGGDDARELVKRYVETCKVGGLIYESSDIVTQAGITNLAQSLAEVPLMIALDAEWGLTMRLSDAPTFPRNLLLGGINDDKLLYEYGRELARECRLMGVHVNLAPVLDVLDREGSVLGSRSFGYSPDVVARHGVAFAKGLEDGGVLSSAKHFPGHGATMADSHKELPIIGKSLAEMKMYDLVPFEKYINAGLGGMLTAHIDVEFLDDGVTPCSMSNACVEGLLKKQMGFEGLVFTDALDMQGAKALDGDPSVNAIVAGNDVLLMPRSAEDAIAAIKQAIDDNVISWTDIETRCKKMLRYKYALGIVDSGKKAIDVDKVRDQINTQYAEDLNRRLIAAATTVVVNSDQFLPLKDVQSGKIPVVSLGLTSDNAFINRCSNYAAISPINSEQMPEAFGDSKQVIVALGDEKYVDDAIAIAKRMDKVAVVILDVPEKIPHYADLITSSHVDAVVVGYGNDDVWQDYAAQTVFGGSSADGVLPITIKSQTNGKVLHAGTGEKTAAVRLGYTLPVEVGFKDNLIAKIDSICNYGIKQRAFPGCQVLVARHGKVVVNRSYGEINFDSGIPVTENTLYGLASVSKATGTLSGIMKLYDSGGFKLDEPASKYIAGLRGTDKSNITFRQLLYHETGMQPSISMWEMMMDPKTYSGKLITNAPTATNTIKIMKGAYGNKNAKLRTDILSTTPSKNFNIAIADGIYGGKITYDSIMNRIYHSKLRPTKKYCYSCLNFCLLANALENISKTSLDQYVDKNIFGKLGAYRTTYRPLNKFSPDEIAYTEFDTYLRKQHIHGYVHDELAAFSGGVQGNAGLFSNANDIAKLCQMWLNGGEYGRETFYKKSTVDTFLKSKSPNSHRGLGFDKPNLKDLESSNTCKEATAETVGHTGFTGTRYWVDPKNDMIYIFLSNRVCPTRDNPAFSRVSATSHIHTLIYQSIEN